MAMATISGVEIPEGTTGTIVGYAEKGTSVVFKFDQSIKGIIQINVMFSDISAI